MSDYGPGARLLYRLALGNPALAELSLDLQRRLAPGDPVAAARGRHVFVTGLARAGTTIVMRRLHASGAFRSLTYADMPFVLAPTLWARLGGARRPAAPAAERAHGDGIRVGLHSPEALDEVFWRVKCGRDYIRETCLVPHAPGDETVEAFVTYVASILHGDGGGRRYLSKNNNNILRLPAIRRAFPQAVILVPFRHPLDQAASLRAQHLRFRRLQAGDRFVLRYMRYLAHHEFGRDHRPFRFAGAPAPGAAPEEIEYWLEVWCAAHEWLLGQSGCAITPLCYDRLVEDPRRWARVAELAGTDEPPDGAEELKRRPPSPRPAADRALLARAEEIYRTLGARSMV
ncbi:MAG: sulfotransferase [Paracoccaceae bacterium]